MNASLLAAWQAILARRRQCNTSGQDGSDFAEWLQFQGVAQEPVQLELFA